MADFDQAQTFVHTAEGGYQDHPRDPGNYVGGKLGVGALIGTNHGISAPVLSRYLGRPATRQEMRELSYATALQIYRTNYWQPLALDQLTDQQLALLLYDAAVNQGPRVARQALAFALGTANVPIRAAHTNADLVRLANAQDAAALHAAAWQYRHDRYPKRSPFTAGWLNRLEKLRRK